MAAFSSRGPKPITPEILKQNFIAPGVNIIAGLTGKFGPSGLKVDTRHVEFNIVSGTSMSCPHASGLATLVKSAHPEWSPASIKSALMTTAYNTYKNGKTIQDIATGMPSAPFDHGAGQYNLGDFNYPSFVVPFETALGKDGGNIAPAVIKYTRTLTNVGNLTAYKVSVSSETSSVKITVEPETLAFSRPNEKKNYTLTFTTTSLPSGTTSFARI